MLGCNKYVDRGRWASLGRSFELSRGTNERICFTDLKQGVLYREMAVCRGGVRGGAAAWQRMLFHHLPMSGSKQYSVSVCVRFFFDTRVMM